MIRKTIGKSVSMIVCGGLESSRKIDTKKGDFKAFLCAIAKYKAIDLLRKELKRTSKEISMYEEESIKEIKQLYQEERGFYKQKKMHPMKNWENC